MSMVIDYIRLMLFSAGLLVGAQLPAVVDQYAKRVDAHYIEATKSLAGFQQTADAFFSGDIEKLVAHYQKSDDKVFRKDAASIQAIYLRVQVLKAEMQWLNRSDLLRSYHVVFDANSEMMDETMQQYSYSLLLNPQALIWGICIAFCIAMLAELLLKLGFGLIFKTKVMAK